MSKDPAQSLFPLARLENITIHKLLSRITRKILPYQCLALDQILLWILRKLSTLLGIYPKELEKVSNKYMYNHVHNSSTIRQKNLNVHQWMTG